MIKRSQHSLKFITGKKKQHLLDLFNEYQIVVNKFIQQFWSEPKLPQKPTKEQWRQVNSWLCGKVMKCAYRQAIQMIKTTQDKNKKLIYKQYRRTFFKAKIKNKNWSIVNQTWTEWSKNKQFRNRVCIPVFNGDSIDLNSDLVHIYPTTKMTKFDLAVRLGSIWGNRLSIVLPTKKHRQFNSLIDKGYELNSSIQLRKIGNELYLNLFLEKETPKPKVEGKIIGIDIGLKKLMSTSEGEFYGQEFEKLLVKLKGRKVGSANHQQTITEIKNYINNQVNKLDFSDKSVIVMEKLNLSKMKEKNGKSNKHLRRKLNNWNARLLFQKINSLSEENRVLLAYVDAEYTSQKCSSCGAIHKESRAGERYSCVVCGYSLDADTNGAINIRNRFLNKELTVPYEQETKILVDFTNIF